MRTPRMRWTTCLGLLALLLAVATASAQPKKDKKDTEGEGGAKSDATMTFRKGSQLSLQVQLKQADHYHTKMLTIHVNVKKTAERAKLDKDIIKLNCVNDKLILVVGNIKVAEFSIKQLKEAARRRDDEARNHAFAKLTISYQKTIVLEQESDACIGEDIAYVGATRVETEVDPDITEEDPTSWAPVPVEPIERPEIQSPYF